jgi:hypothetical protein
VLAVSSRGTGPVGEEVMGNECRQFRSLNVDSRNDLLSLTPPMLITDDFRVMVAPGNNSLAAPPAHGRARLDFQAAQTVKVKLWMRMMAPNKDSDSFWVRMDDGAWIKWNNILNGQCQTVRNSDAGGAVVVYNIGAGSHRFEWAYREEGAAISGGRLRVLESDDTDPQPCDD